MHGNILSSFLKKTRFLLLIFFVTELSAQDFYIRSLMCYSSDEQTSMPIIDNKELARDLITIEFDILGNYSPNLDIVFKFCDSDWQPYENVFLANPVYDTEYNLYLERLPTTITGASYHYKGTFPNHNVTFPFSGKWKYFIVDSQNKNSICAEGNFYVVKSIMDLRAAVFKERLEGGTPPDPSLGETIAIRSYVELPDSLFQSQLKKVEIIENHKIFEPIIVDRENRTMDRFFEWNGANYFTFIARQLLPGNDYRQTDFTNVGLYPPGTINAQHTGVETSDFFKKHFKDFNGGQELSDFRDRYSDYLSVNFKLRAPENITSPIFLVGSFTGWKVLPEYEMFDDSGLMNITVQLKRGAYDYQYVTADYVNEEIKNINWYTLEGNFWTTRNDYYVFLYYESMEKGGYDQIIGYRKITSGELWGN